MRILMIGINFAPELTGIGKYSGEMAAFLVKKGHEVRMITAPPYYPHWQIGRGYTGWDYRIETWQGVKVYRCPLWLPGRRGKAAGIGGLQRLIHLFSFALSSLPVTLGQVGWRPERVIVVAPSLLNAPAGLLLARLTKARSWLHIQDFELEAAFRMRLLPGMTGLSKLGLRMESILYRGYDHISTISNRMVAKLYEKGVTPQRASLFPNWVDMEQIFPIQGYNGLRREFNIADRCQVVLYSGNMGQKQGLELLVEAARRLRDEPDLLFLLCGEGAMKPKLEALAQGLGNLRFLSLQPLERLNELLNLATLHVLPQHPSAADLVMPSKLSGMLASGRPVIVTAVPGTELEAVVTPIGRVVPPQQPQMLADAILELVRQPARQVELGELGRAYVEQTWGKKLVLEKFLNALVAL